MQCDEFRKLVLSRDNMDETLEHHLQECPSCASWLDAEIEKPPQGLTPAEWQAATARCFPAIDMTKPAAVKNDESFWDFFINGMKYGVVFGLSIVTGFALLSLKPSASPHPGYDLEAREKISFIEDSGPEKMVFIESSNSDVTFLSYDDSELSSFVENSELPDFIEYDKEEDTWKEQAG
jgi:hypothetical protein